MWVSAAVTRMSSGPPSLGAVGRIPAVPRLGPLQAPRTRGLERWFAQQGSPPLLDLGRSGAPGLSARDVLDLSGADPAALLDVSLDYDDGAGRPGLRAAIAASGAARRAGEVLVTHGAVEALLLCCAAIGVHGRHVLVATPGYEALARTPAALGAAVERVDVWRPGSEMLDLDPLIARVRPGVAAVVVNSPANPSGATAEPEQLAALAGRCAATGATLVVDEVAVRTLDPEARSVTAAPWFGDGDAVAIGDASKQCGLGGLRCGWLSTASGRLLNAAAALKDLTSLGNAAPAELLAQLALEHRESIVAAVRDAAHRNLATLTRWVAGRGGARLTLPRDGLVALAFLPEVATAAAAERLRREHGVALVPGELLGVPGHVRLGLGLAPGLFAEALGRLDAAIRSPAG